RAGHQARAGRDHRTARRHLLRRDRTRPRRHEVAHFLPSLRRDCARRTLRRHDPDLRRRGRAGRSRCPLRSRRGGAGGRAVPRVSRQRYAGGLRGIRCEHRRVRLGVILLVGIALIGIFWFWLVEHWSLLDASEQTITTITTVGLGEVRPFDSSAKAFSIVLSIFGVGIALFTLGALFSEQIEESLARYGRR